MPQANAENFRENTEAYNVFLLLCFQIPPTNLAHPLCRRVPDYTHLSVTQSNFECSVGMKQEILTDANRCPGSSSYN